MDEQPLIQKKKKKNYIIFKDLQAKVFNLNHQSSVLSNFGVKASLNEIKPTIIY